MSEKNYDVAILMGSKSDWHIMKGVIDALNYFDLSHDVKVLSAHRAPSLVIDYIKTSEAVGTGVFICGAGGAAHLAGLVAAHSTLPVIGVPVASGALQGEDALLATVQMPRGIPVATVAINGSFNAGILAAQILSHKYESLKSKLKLYKEELAKKVVEASISLEKELEENS